MTTTASFRMMEDLYTSFVQYRYEDIRKITGCVKPCKHLRYSVSFALHSTISVKDLTKADSPHFTFSILVSSWLIFCFHELSSSIFTVQLSFVCPASVTPPLISTKWCFRPYYKPYIFCEDMILATCQCRHILRIHCWVEPSLLLSSFKYTMSL